MKFNKEELEVIIKSLVASRGTAEFDKPVGVYECMIDNVVNAFMNSATFDPANNFDAAVFNVVGRAFNQYKMQINNLARENDILRMKLAGVNNGVNVPDEPDQKPSDTAQVGCGCGLCSPVSNPKPIKIKPMMKMPQTPLCDIERVKSLEEILADEMAILDSLVRAEHPEQVVNISNAAFTQVNIALKARMVELDMINMLTGNEPTGEPKPETDEDEMVVPDIPPMELAFNKMARSIDNAIDINEFDYEDEFKDCINGFANLVNAINAKIAAHKDLRFSINQEAKVLKTYADCICGSKDVDALKETLTIICPTPEIEAANAVMYNSIVNIFRNNEELEYVNKVIMKIKNSNAELIEIDPEMDNHATALSLIGAYNTTISKLMEEVSDIKCAIDSDELIDSSKINNTLMKRIAATYNAFSCRHNIGAKLVTEKSADTNKFLEKFYSTMKSGKSFDVYQIVHLLPDEYEAIANKIGALVARKFDEAKSFKDTLAAEKLFVSKISEALSGCNTPLAKDAKTMNDTVKELAVLKDENNKLYENTIKLINAAYNNPGFSSNTVNNVYALDMRRMLNDICEQLDNLGKLNVEACVNAAPDVYKEYIKTIVTDANNIIDANKDMNDTIIFESTMLKDLADSINNTDLACVDVIAAKINCAKVDRFRATNKDLFGAVIKVLEDRDKVAESFNVNDNNIKLINPDVGNNADFIMPVGVINQCIGVNKPFLAIFNDPITGQLFTGIYKLKKDMQIHEYYSDIVVPNRVVFATPLAEEFIDRYAK